MRILLFASSKDKGGMDRAWGNDTENKGRFGEVLWIEIKRLHDRNIQAACWTRASSSQLRKVPKHRNEY